MGHKRQKMPAGTGVSNYKEIFPPYIYPEGINQGRRRAKRLPGDRARDR
jgi:hypothetical protein